MSTRCMMFHDPNYCFILFRYIMHYRYTVINMIAFARDISNPIWQGQQEHTNPYCGIIIICTSVED